MNKKIKPNDIKELISSQTNEDIDLTKGYCFEEEKVDVRELEKQGSSGVESLFCNTKKCKKEANNVKQLCGVKAGNKTRIDTVIDDEVRLYFDCLKQIENLKSKTIETSQMVDLVEEKMNKAEIGMLVKDVMGEELMEHFSNSIKITELEKQAKEKKLDIQELLRKIGYSDKFWTNNYVTVESNYNCIINFPRDVCEKE